MAAVPYQFLHSAGSESLEEELKTLNIAGKDFDALFSFLTWHGHDSLSSVHLGSVIMWRTEVRKRYSKKHGMDHYASLLENAMMRFLEPSFEELWKEIEDKHSLSRAEGNKVRTFLMMKGIRRPAEISCRTRKEYEQFLISCRLEDTGRYVKVLDQIKLKSIEEENKTRPFPKRQLHYENDVLYLGYHPDFATAMEFYYVRNKEELVFDFSTNAPVRLKHQVFAMLNHCLEMNISNKMRREMYIVPLKLLYLYCEGCGISDLEKMTQADIDGFKKSLDGSAGTKKKIYLQIVNSTRRFLFLTSPKTNWDAHVWYMDRFAIKEERANPAYHTVKFSFCMIQNEENRDLFKSFMRYLIGISHRALNTVQAKYISIRMFLKYCDDKGIQAGNITPLQMDAYMEYLDQKGNDSATFNKSLNALAAFYGYLGTKGKISKNPVQSEYYRKKEYYLHHDRYPGRESQMDLLGRLYLFPEHLRLMSIVLWATGLRINEVCTLKGNAFSFEEGDAYLKVMQYKQVLEKKIPIPSVLYYMMCDYIERKDIKAREYIFKNKKGGAYYASTFRSQMQQLCHSYGIGGPDYVFRPHDFRHLVGTQMFDSGVSLQAIRDYHGHRDENMTKQYIDYMPAKVHKANREYYEENSLLGKREDR